MMTRSYHELKKLKTFEERYQYLKLSGVVGKSTFGFDRYMNQALYTSKEWRKARDKVIIRDNGCDLGIEGYEISGPITVHHMNPVTIEQLENGDPIIFDPDYLISASTNTDRAIHFADESILPKPLIERRPNDTCPWKK